MEVENPLFVKEGDYLPRDYAFHFHVMCEDQSVDDEMNRQCPFLFR